MSTIPTQSRHMPGKVTGKPLYALANQLIEASKSVLPAEGFEVDALAEFTGGNHDYGTALGVDRGRYTRASTKTKRLMCAIRNPGASKGSFVSTSAVPIPPKTPRRSY
ncbi:MAG: hypothetical protein AAF585_17495 [Verrucomicrobiota bacterium]